MKSLFIWRECKGWNILIMYLYYTQGGCTYRNGSLARWSPWPWGAWPQHAEPYHAPACPTMLCYSLFLQMEVRYRKTSILGVTRDFLLFIFTISEIPAGSAPIVGSWAQMLQPPSHENEKQRSTVLYLVMIHWDTGWNNLKIIENLVGDDIFKCILLFWHLIKPTLP